jgi:hypothetical protein
MLLRMVIPFLTEATEHAFAGAFQQQNMIFNSNKQWQSRIVPTMFLDKDTLLVAPT